MSLSVKPFNFGLNQIRVIAHSRLILVSTGISLPGTIDNNYVFGGIGESKAENGEKSMFLLKSA